ncbi:MAG: hypothetical protein PHE50_00010 [Dehalococcoidales bacterium]|nr:hypothetical protein [Dehalococcoidales bacterium]
MAIKRGEQMLDYLSQYITPTTLQAGPMMLAAAQPQVTPQPPLGTGLAQGVADVKALYPIWQRQFIDGETTAQFKDWLKEQQIQNPLIKQ